MTEPLAADDLCEHHYETRILGGRPISVRACVFCRTPDWADLDEQAAELYRWGWQEGCDGKAARETLSAYDKPRQEPATAPVTAQDTPGGPGQPTGGPKPPQTALQRLRRLRGQLAAEHAKAVAADQAAVQRPDRADLRVNPHNGTAAGLEISVGLADHHLREAGEEVGGQP
jgi:hypothetical protein